MSYHINIVIIPMYVYSENFYYLSLNCYSSCSLCCMQFSAEIRITSAIFKTCKSYTLQFIIISTTFQPICPPAFFSCLSNSGTFTELRTTFFIESTRVACSDSVGHNRVQVLSIPVLLLACSQDWICNLLMIFSLED